MSYKTHDYLNKNWNCEIDIKFYFEWLDETNQFLGCSTGIKTPIDKNIESTALMSPGKSDGTKSTRSKGIDPKYMDFNTCPFKITLEMPRKRCECLIF